MCINRRKKYADCIYLFGAVSLVILIGALVYMIYLAKTGASDKDFWANVIFGILTSVVASYIFGMLQNAFSTDKEKVIIEKLNAIEISLIRQNELYDSGIKSIHPKANFDTEEEYWKHIIEGAESRLDLLGHSMSPWFSYEYKSSFCERIKKLLRSNKKVRIIMSGVQFPDMTLVKQVYRTEKDKKLLNKEEKTIFEFIKLLKEIEIQYRSNLELHFVDQSKVTYMYIRNDSECIISPYIQSAANSQNSFLLELKPDTKYEKAFIKDFRELLESSSCLNLSVEPYFVRTDKPYKVVNTYSASGWNKENTEKYIFYDKANNSKYEVGLFEHFNVENGFEKYVKTVIEMPVSYGCRSGCKFCASSQIKPYVQLLPEQLMELFQSAYSEIENPEKKQVLLSITGSGDICYNFENVILFLENLRTVDKLQITLSSCFWSKEYLESIEKLSKTIIIRKVQITYVTNEKSILYSLIPISSYFEMPNVNQVIEYIKMSSKKYYRINYIMIKDINDSGKEWEEFINLFSDVKEKITVRISRLNQTTTTQKNNLHEVEVHVMRNFQKKLQNNGFESYLYYAEVNDNMNCGQLITEI